MAAACLPPQPSREGAALRPAPPPWPGQRHLTAPGRALRGLPSAARVRDGEQPAPFFPPREGCCLKRIHFYNNPHGFAASRPPHSVPQPPGALAAALPCHGLLRVVQRKKMQPCNHHVRSWRLTLQYFIFIIFFQAR